MFGGFAPLPLRLGGTDPTLRWTPEQHARVAADIAAAKRAAPLAAWSFTNNGSVVAVQNYLGQNGVGAPYAPDGAVRTATGTIEFTWSKPWLDEYDISEPLAVRAVFGGGNGATAVVVSGAIITRGIRVYTKVLGVASDVNGCLVIQ